MNIPIKHARVCRYCPEGTGIIWHEEDALRMHDGTWKCLKCVNTDTNKLMVNTLGKDHHKVKTIIQNEQQEIDRWNNYAASINNANKRMGGTKDILGLRDLPCAKPLPLYSLDPLLCSS